MTASGALPDVILLPPFIIRPMHVEDIDAVMAIERRVYSQPWSVSGYVYELTENRLAHYDALLVAAGPGQTPLIGYIGHWLMADEAHISTIVIEPTWRRRRLGELLLVRALLRAHDQGACLATLEVRRSNQAAQALYRKLGFALVGERGRYYRDNLEDALIMTLSPLDAGSRAMLEQRWAELSEHVTRRVDHG